MTPGRSKPDRKPALKPAPPRRKAGLLWLVGVLALTFLAYWPSLDNGFTNWDDNTYVTDNPFLVRPDFRTVLLTPISGNFHPLTIWSLALNYRISGLHPGSYHWLNLLLHLANTALVFFFVRRLSHGRLWTSVTGALFFGIHPMHAESVAWISERKDVLYGFFYLAGLYTYLRYLDGRRWGWLLPTFLLFVLSVASKVAAVVFPLTLLALDWYRRRPPSPRTWLEKVPFFAVSAAAGLVALTAQRAVGAMNVQWTWFEKLLFACYGTMMYVVKLVLPVHLSAIYPYSVIQLHGPGPEFYLALVLVVVGVPAVLYVLREVRPVLFGAAFFAINIVLVLQFATVGQAVMADRYTYLPYIGLLFALAWWLDERPGPRVRGIPVRPVVAGWLILLAPLSVVQTWRRCEVWQNSETLWNDTIQKYPRAIYDAYTHRGDYYRTQGRYAEALADFNQAIALNAGVPRAWNFKGMTLAATGRIDSAAVCFDRAIALKPDFASAWSNRGGVRFLRGDFDSALADYNQALALDPRIWDAYTNRALLYAQRNEHESAAADLRQALALKPGLPTNYLYRAALGQALAALGRHAEAVAEFDRAIASAPSGDPRLGGYYLDRSRSWLSIGDRARALSDADQAAGLGADVDSVYLRGLR